MTALDDFAAGVRRHRLLTRWSLEPPTPEPERYRRKLRERTGGNAKWKQLGDYDRAMPDRGAR